MNVNHSFDLVPFGGILCFCLFAILAIGLLVFWIWALVDCIKNEPSQGNDKIIWVLVILLLQWIGALVYVVVRRPQRIRELGK